MVLEAGQVGRGVMGSRDIPEHAETRIGDEREVHYSATSGSACLPAPVSCVKMAIRCQQTYHQLDEYGITLLSRSTSAMRGWATNLPFHATTSIMQALRVLDTRIHQTTWA